MDANLPRDSHEPSGRKNTVDRLIEGVLPRNAAAAFDSAMVDHLPSVEGYKLLASCLLFDEAGAGGFGKVYRGRHLTFAYPFDCAVKCLFAGRDAERFEIEATLGAQLNHPNLVRVFETGSVGPLHYIVMEWVDGESATQRLARSGGRLPLAEVVAIGYRTCLGLAHLHAADVVHRDIKPSNLMITRSGEVKVADLGIAKAPHSSTEGLTVTGRYFGTPQYMAPEQWRDPKRVGRAADVYSLGATLYHLLHGQPGLTGSVEWCRERIESEGFPRLADQETDHPAEIVELIDRCTCTDPEDRFESVEDLAQALRALPFIDDIEAPLPMPTVPESEPGHGPTFEQVRAARAWVRRREREPRPADADDFVDATRSLDGEAARQLDRRAGTGSDAARGPKLGTWAGAVLFVAAAVVIGMRSMRPSDAAPPQSRDRAVQREVPEVATQVESKPGPAQPSEDPEVRRVREGRALLETLATSADPPPGPTREHEVRLVAPPESAGWADLLVDGRPEPPRDGVLRLPLVGATVTFTLSVAGAESIEPVRLQYTIDRKPPVLTLAELPGPSPVDLGKTSTVVLAGSVGPDAVEVQLRHSSPQGESEPRALAVVGGAIEERLELSEGQHELRVRAVDALGNDVEVSRTVTVPGRLARRPGLQRVPVPATGEVQPELSGGGAYRPVWRDDAPAGLDLLVFLPPSDDGPLFALTELTRRQWNAAGTGWVDGHERYYDFSPSGLPVDDVCFECVSDALRRLNDLVSVGCPYEIDLPTVAEWEQFARTNAHSSELQRDPIYPFPERDPCSVANVRDALVESHAVGELPSTERRLTEVLPLDLALNRPQGLLRARQLGGNVAELCTRVDPQGVVQACFKGGSRHDHKSAIEIRAGRIRPVDRHGVGQGVRLVLRRRE